MLVSLVLSICIKYLLTKSPKPKTMNKKYKIFDYTWHIPHQYDLLHALRDDCEFYFCLNLRSGWDTTQRPIPPNLNFVTHYEPGAYDVAMLHVDQSSILRADKRAVYEQFNEVITDIPKIVINHGTPVFPEAYSYRNLSELEAQERCKAQIKELIGDHIMVVNSHASASEKEWGWGIPIVHGMRADDWWDLPKEPRVFSALSTWGLDIYYNRQRLIEVSEYLDSVYGYPLSYAKVNIDTGSSPEAYKNYLGSSLLYFDPSIRTPMNRARTEAFLSGCCVIQVEGAHDLELWAEHGENIILVPDDTAEIAKTMAYYLTTGYHEAVKVGQRGKQMAMKQFNPEKYRQQWLNVLKQATSN